MADRGIAFDGRTPEERPLGGAESAFVDLANALAARGHAVTAFTRCERAVDHRGVAWRPLVDDLPDAADLYIANRSHVLVRRVPRARRTVFWVHNPARHLTKPRYLWKLALRRPVIVFSGAHHASTYPAWGLAGGREVVPYGIAATFTGAGERAAVPPPRAVFTSNPLRSLDWLLDVWSDRIRPRVPGAELHLFCGAATYGSAGAAKSDRMAPVLAEAARRGDDGVVLRGPVPKERLVRELAEARCLLYRGDEGETFCLAVAEAQAMGLPAVVEDIACMKERVVDGVTGFVVRGADAFAEAAVRVLTDDAQWRAQHAASLARQRAWTWDHAARRFEEIGRLTPVAAV